MTKQQQQQQIKSIRVIPKLLSSSCSTNNNLFPSKLKLSYRWFIDDDDNDNDKNNRLSIIHIDCRFECFQLIYFLYCFNHYSTYRKLVWENLSKLYSTDDNQLNLLIKCWLQDNPPNPIRYQNIDTDWCQRIQYFVTLRMDLEESSSWLSTLGGAYSSLGDKNQQFAYEAERISWKQMKLSLIFGDPNLVCRCLIYLCHSWCQQKKRRQAIRLIRYYLYPLLLSSTTTTSTNNDDRIVRRMYQHRE